MSSVERGVELARHRDRRQNVDAGSRELDRKRQAVEPAADLRDGRCVGVGEAEPGVYGTRSREEEPHGVVAPSVSSRRASFRPGAASGGTT